MQTSVSMKAPIKTLLKTTILSLLTILNSCTPMNNQTTEIINHNRTQLSDNLKKLESQKIISSAESKQISDRLNSDFDYYLQHQDIDFKGVEKMFSETTKSFENIKINRSIFTVIQSTYHAITAQITMRHMPMKQEDYKIGVDLVQVANQWFENYQSDEDKLTDLITQIDKEKQLNHYPDISADEYDQIINTVTKIKADTTISDTELKKILMDGMQTYCNKSNGSNLSILNMYDAVNRIKKLGISEELSAVCQRNQSKPKEPSYSEIKQQVLGRFKILLTEEMISQGDFELLTSTILNDVEFCEKHTDKPEIKAQLLSGLKKLKIVELDTEDREAITDWYFILSQKAGVDIKSDLNTW
jgi:hypothetical protein